MTPSVIFSALALHLVACASATIGAQIAELKGTRDKLEAVITTAATAA